MESRAGVFSRGSGVVMRTAQLANAKFRQAILQRVPCNALKGNTLED